MNNQYQVPNQFPNQAPNQFPNQAPNQFPNQAPNQSDKVSIILAAISMVAWLIPLFGYPVAIAALIRSAMKKSTPGIILSVIGLILTIINSIAGAVMFSK